MDFKGITLNVWRFFDTKDERLSLHYRASDRIEKANAVIKPFIEARKEMRRKEKEGYEFSLTPEDKASFEKVENHSRALQEWEAKGFFKFLYQRPERPTDEQVKKWKEISEKRSEFESRIANPLIDLLKEDGEAMLKDLISGWIKSGFKIKNRVPETNGEYVKETIELA